MLSRLHVQNFRCLRDVTIDFSPLTVLIGKNDSGKTSILDAIRVLGETMTRPIPEVFSGVNHPDVLSWRRERKTIAWDITTSHPTRGEYRYWFDLRRSLAVEERESSPWEETIEMSVQAPEVHRGHWSHLATALNSELWEEHDPTYRDLEEYARDGLLDCVGYLRELRRYRFSPDALRQPGASKPEVALSSSGDTLAVVLDRLISGPDRTKIGALEHDLQAAIPSLKGLSLRVLEDGKKTIEYVLATPSKRPITIPCENASDGALLVTAYLALAYSDEPGTLLIEEPENGLHPSLLRLVFETLHKISTGEYGLGPRQVIIATQSPLLLNYATKEEVRIVRRDLENGTEVTPLAEVPDIDRLLKGFAIGELWYHLGEDALVEGEKAE